MEIVTAESEQRLVEILPLVEQNAASWMYVHVNIATMHGQLLNREGVSKASLNRIREMSVQIARRLSDLGLDKFEGSILVFEDSDVLALFIKKSDTTHDVLERLRSEFNKSGQGHVLAIEEMQEKLTQLVVISKEKKQTAEHLRMKWQAVETAEKLMKQPLQDAELLRAIHKKRRRRKSGSVLIIEDDVLARGLVTTLLRGEYEVVAAKDALGGFITYIDNAPNIVFLDIHLPDLSGHEILKRLRLLDHEAHIIMLSGDSAEENVISAHSHGAAGFIRKPFSKQKILEYIKQCPSLQQSGAKDVPG